MHFFPIKLVFIDVFHYKKVSHINISAIVIQKDDAPGCKIVGTPGYFTGKQSFCWQFLKTMSWCGTEEASTKNVREKVVDKFGEKWKKER